MIPTERQATVRAVVPANREVFAYLLSATTALLACTTGIHLHNHGTSLFSFVLEDAHEPAPGGVRDCLAESVAPGIPWMFRLSTAIRP
jgi:hypothetical protein